METLYIGTPYKAPCRFSGTATGITAVLHANGSAIADPVTPTLSTPVEIAGQTVVYVTLPTSGRDVADYLDITVTGTVGGVTESYTVRLVMVAPALTPMDIAEDMADALTAYGAAKTTDLLGPGADSCTLTITDSAGNAVADADVWITSTLGGSAVAGTRQTDSSGHVTFLLDAGSTYYLYAQKNGKNAIMGQEFIAEADE